MKCSAPVIAALLPLVSLVSAAPAVGTAVLEERKTVHIEVEFCNGENFKTGCSKVEFNVNESKPDTPKTCWAVPKKYKHNVGSIRPPKGYLCYASEGNTCSSLDDLNIQYPGYGNLFSHGGKDWGHSIQALQCIECTGCQ